MINFFHRNMALVLAPIMTAVTITLYNLTCLLLRHHHALQHDLLRAAGALILLVVFYGIIRYMQSLPDEES